MSVDTATGPTSGSGVPVPAQPNPVQASAVSSGGNSGARKGKPTGEARLYDFRRPTKLSRDHVRVLEIALDTFARQWTTLLTTTLRAVSTVSLRSIQQLTYDEYVGSLPSPTVMMILSVEPLEGAGILQFSLDSAMTSVDHLLGGPGLPPQPERALTEIESMLLKGVVDRVLHELTYATETLMKIEPVIVNIEHNPQFAQAAAPSDLVIVMSFDMKIGADECVATLCLPFNDVFPHLEKAIAGSGFGRDRRDREAAALEVATRLGVVPVDVSVRFTPTVVRMSDVVNLQVGDVLPLAHPVSQPLAITAAGVTFAYAVPGSEGKSLACLIVNPPQEADS